MTQHIDLDALQAAAEAATPGPWHSVHHGISCGDDERENICRVAETLGKYEYEKANRDFIAAANPAAVIELIARLRKVEEREAQLTNSLTEMRHWFEAERKSISKGNGSQWSMWQCEEQMEEIDKALSVAAPSDSVEGAKG